MQQKLKLLLLVLALALGTGCSKDDKENNNTYPKTVSVEYKLTPSAGVALAGTITYINETGGNTGLTNQALPFSVKFTRTVNRSTGLGVGVTASGNGSIKCEIIIDNTVVKTETYTGNSIITGSSAYLFP
jgi:hypothetical protein